MKRPTLTLRLLSMWEHWIGERQKKRVLSEHRRTFTAVLRDAQDAGAG